MDKPSKDPGVYEEPHLSGDDFQLDPSEKDAENILKKPRSAKYSEDQQIEQSVWDEPGLSHKLSVDMPADEITYEKWLGKRKSETGNARSWAITCALALVAGPFAIVGALLGEYQTGITLLLIVVFGPMAEEMLKIGAALYVVEKRPFLFRSDIQIVVCVVSGAFVFAAIENLLYLNLASDPSPGIIAWRWTVCVALHTGCSLIASLGLVRIWRDVWRRKARPRLSLGASYIIIAVVIHGAYNGFAVLLEALDFRF